MKWEEKTVLVTGGNGFLGSAVINELQKKSPQKNYFSILKRN